MIVMDVFLDNFYSFSNFHMNFSYPKKIVNSYIPNEFLTDRPNFRYKKAVILMGANATGKTSLGRMLLNIFNFIDRSDAARLQSAVGDTNRTARFSIDFLIDKPTLFRVSAVLDPAADNKKNLSVKVQSVQIGANDSYEKCKERLDLQKDAYSENYIDVLNQVPSLGWAFRLTENTYSNALVNFDSDERLQILETILKVLDPAIVKVERLPQVENSYVIQFINRQVIIQDGHTVNPNVLSAGTSKGIDVADMLARIISGENGFYYCDEKFSYIQSDVEKAILTIMIDRLSEYDQLIFTTHNSDILDLPYPKHTFMFLKKDIHNPESPISVINASDFLKRNTDSLRNAIENDLFGVTPDVDSLYKLENIK